MAHAGRQGSDRVHFHRVLQRAGRAYQGHTKGRRSKHPMEPIREKEVSNCRRRSTLCPLGEAGAQTTNSFC